MNAASILDIFPQELIDRVIDESADSAATLRSCALVCKAFLPSSQAHIFLNIDCTITATSMAQNRFERLSQVLSISPHLARHIQSLRITCPFHDDMDAETDLAVLYVPLTLVISLIPVLRSFDMTDSTGSVWTRLSARCKAAICDLCERSNLSKLHLQGIVALSVTEFSQLVSSPSLTELSLGSVTILDLPPTNGEMITGDNSKLDILTLHESESTDIIMPWLVRGGRLSQLRHLYGTWNLGRTPHLQGLIDASGASLHALVLVTYFGVSSHHLPRLSLSSATSLRLITLYFPSVFTKDGVHLIPRITDFLGSQGSPSTLTTISLGFDVQPEEFSVTLAGPKNWNILARLLSEDRFPVLETFTISLHTFPGVTTRLPDRSEEILAKARQAFSHLEARGILKLRSSVGIPVGFFNAQMSSTISVWEE